MFLSKKKSGRFLFSISDIFSRTKSKFFSRWEEFNNEKVLKMTTNMQP